MITNIINKKLIKSIFKKVNEKQKLKIIKDNKNLQNMIDVNILNYKLYSKKTIKFTGKISEGKGKEYNKKGVLLFEGEYKCRKREGKGKEFSENGKVIFEGEYICGKRVNI